MIGAISTTRRLTKSSGATSTFPEPKSGNEFRWPFYSLSRTACGRGNHQARRAIQGVEIIEAENLARLCAEFAADKKAENIVVLDLREISTFTDFFVICSAGSEPQLKAIAGEIETRLKDDHGIRAAAVDGFPASQWIVLDYLQVVVHVFHRDKREFYSLEDLGAMRRASTGKPAMRPSNPRASSVVAVMRSAQPRARPRG